jgi:transposase-like protein
MTLWKWMRRADIDDRTKPKTTSQESAELRQTRRRIKLLEQENEVLRRAAAYLAQAHLPGKGSTRS